MVVEFSKSNIVIDSQKAVVDFLGTIGINTVKLPVTVTVKEGKIIRIILGNENKDVTALTQAQIDAIRQQYPDLDTVVTK